MKNIVLKVHIMRATLRVQCLNSNVTAFKYSGSIKRKSMLNRSKSRSAASGSRSTSLSIVEVRETEKLVPKQT
jgi:hypothetical protein